MDLSLLIYDSCKLYRVMRLKLDHVLLVESLETFVAAAATAAVSVLIITDSVALFVRTNYLEYKTPQSNQLTFLTQ